MRALIRKELAELAMLTPLWVLPLIALWFMVANFQGVLLWPERLPHLAVAGPGCLLGFVVGLASHARERLLRTEPYLCFRPMGISGVFLAKAGVALGLAYFLAVLPALAWVAYMALGSPLATILQWERVAELLATGTIACTGASLGLVCSQLRRQPFLDVLVGVAGAFGVFLVSEAVGSRIGWPERSGGWTAMQLGATALLVPIAWHLARERRDRDLPLADVQHVAWGTSSLVLVLVPALLLLTTMQSRFVAMRWHAEPAIVEDPTKGELLLGNWKPDGFRTTDGRLVRAVSRGTTIDVDGSDLSILFDPSDGPVPKEGTSRVTAPQVEIREVPFSERAEESDGEWGARRHWYFRVGSGDTIEIVSLFDPTNGVLRVFVLPVVTRLYHHLGDIPKWPEGVDLPCIPSSIELRRDDGLWFGSLNGLPSRAAESTAFVDVSDRSIWVLDPTARPMLRPDALPDGDRVMGTKEVYWRDSPRVFSSFSSILGEKGTYLWTSDGFEDAGPYEMAVTGRWNDQPRGWSLEFTQRSSFEIVVSVRAMDSVDVVLTHLYSLDRGPEWLGAYLSSAVSLLRPTWQLLWAEGLAASDVPLVRTTVVDAIFAGAPATWLVTLSVMSNLAAVCFGLFRLRRRGAPTWLLVAWIGLLAAGGPLMLLVLLHLEARARAVQTSEATVPVRELLIPRSA